MPTLHRSLHHASGLLPIIFLIACGGSGNPNTGGAAGSSSSSSSSGGSGGAGTPSDAGADAPDPDGPWTFAPITVDGLPFVWGGIVAQESAKVAYLAGGVAGTSGPTSKKLLKVEQGPSGVTVTTVSTGLAARYCGCAMVDAKRHELLVIGGRDGSFVETPSAELVDLETGTVTAFDAGAAADHPVGCHAVFLPDRDEGYVFGGAAQSSGFGAQTWRYSPVDHALTLLGGSGPPARYDGALRYPHAGGAVWLVGGMGLAGASLKFYADVWKLDPASGTWSEVTAGGPTPPGRRLPWVAFAGDQSGLLMGFGSDSAQGKTMLGDLWRFDISAGAWTELPRTMDPQPEARGFATWLPGPAGSVGLLAGGLLDGGPAKDALVIQGPVPGDWR